MSLIYAIKTNNEHFYFHYVSKLLTSNEIEVSLTTTESRFLLQLCQSQVNGVVIIPRAEMESHIWGDEVTGIDRKANLNQLICTLRKKISKITLHPVVITQPKKGYSLDDRVRIEPSPSAENTSAEPTQQRWILRHNLGGLRQYAIPFLSAIVFIVNGTFLLRYADGDSSMNNVVDSKTDGDKSVLTSPVSGAVTVNCIEHLVDRTKFKNYYVVGLNENEVNNEREKEICVPA